MAFPARCRCHSLHLWSGAQCEWSNSWPEKMGDPQEGSHERGPCEVLFFWGGRGPGGTTADNFFHRFCQGISRQSTQGCSPQLGVQALQSISLQVNSSMLSMLSATKLIQSSWNNVGSSCLAKGRSHRSISWRLGALQVADPQITDPLWLGATPEARNLVLKMLSKDSPNGKHHWQILGICCHANSKTEVLGGIAGLER